MFDHLVGNARAKEVIRRMLRQGRLPGALLFAGEDGVGKKLFALELARALNCRGRRGVEACGECSACARTGKFEYPLEDDRDAHKKVVWSEHRDVGLILPYKRSILVDAARDVERETNFRPFEGEARVFLVEDADRLNPQASNALLKTLEEVPPTSHLVLITSRPASLLPTIRSRCQTVRFSPLAAGEVEQYLVSERKHAGKEARLAALASRGRLGHALELNLDDYRENRDFMLGVIEALTVKADRARLLRAAEELSDAKRKDDYEPRLEVLETLIHDLWLLTLRGGDAEVVNEEVRPALARVAERLPPSRASRWLGRVEELRAQLAVNVNRRVATDALFLSMAAD